MRCSRIGAQALACAAPSAGRLGAVAPTFAASTATKIYQGLHHAHRRTAGDLQLADQLLLERLRLLGRDLEQYTSRNVAGVLCASDPSSADGLTRELVHNRI